jgi:predicted CXXCH cytochrome family protein
MNVSLSTTRRGDSMKKNTLLIVVAVAVMFFAMAATAYANTVSGFETWTPGLGGNGAAGSDNPHQSYSTTTVKCAVCHAVHKAPTGGQVLLRDTVANACVVCHIDTDAGNKVIYTNGAHENYYSSNPGSYAHNSDGNTAMSPTNVTCVMCHTVHGAGRITGNVNPVGTKILKPTGFQTTNGAPDPTANGLTREQRITGFCTRCHPYFMDAYTGEVVTDTIAGSTAYRSHVMKVADANYTGAGATFAGQVAFAPSTDCRDCHDAGLINQGTGQTISSFPHRTPGAERFLKRADHVNDTTNATDSADANSDGVCLKCHATGTNGVPAITGGVGFSY